MADTPVTLTTVLNALPQRFRGRVRAQINRRSVLLRMLRIERGEGKNVAFAISSSGAIAENFADADAVTNFGSDAEVPVTLPWATIRTNLRIGDVSRAAARSREVDGAIKLIVDKYLGGVETLATTINAQLYTGTGGSNSIIGMQTIHRDDNTYGGIDRTTSSFWQSNLIDSGGAALTLAMVRSDVADRIYSAGGEGPDLAFVPPTVFLKLLSLHDAVPRYIQQVDTPRGRIALTEGRTQAIEIEGCTFIKDKDAPALEIQYVNSEETSIEYLPQMDEDSAMEGMREMGVDVDLNDGYGVIPLGMKLYRLGKRSASADYTLQAFLQLKCTKPSANGRRRNFTV